MDDGVPSWSLAVSQGLEGRTGTWIDSQTMTVWKQSRHRKTDEVECKRGGSRKAERKGKETKDEGSSKSKKGKERTN